MKPFTWEEGTKKKLQNVTIKLLLSKVVVVVIVVVDVVVGVVVVK